MLCEEIMTRDFQYVRPDDTAQAAAHRMRQYNVGFLPVCQGRTVLGSVTDRNLATRIVADNRAVTTAVAELMTPEDVSCRPEDDIVVAERLMRDHDKAYVLCIDDRGDLVGLVSLEDVRALKGEPRPIETFDPALRARLRVH
jgi:CBS domain-containing protein